MRLLSRSFAVKKDTKISPLLVQTDWIISMSEGVPRTVQGRVSDKGFDGPTFVPKKWLIFTSLGQGLSKKVCFFLNF